MDPAKDLLKKVLASDGFKASPGISGLLTFLVDNMHRPLSAREIEIEHFRVPVDSYRFDSGHARERLGALKNLLERYATLTPEGDWKFELPDAVRGVGYQVRLVRLPYASSATRLLWKAHLESELQTSVVCNPVLFFIEPKGCVVRFEDTPAYEVNERMAIAELRRRHPDACNKAVRAGHLFMDTGEVLASERIREWFWQSAGLRLPLMLSIDANGISGSSPIHLGSVRTNRHVRRFFEQPAAASFAFRFDAERFGCVSVRDASETEIARFRDAGLTPKDKACGTFDATGVGVGIITRFVSPSRSQTMTIIAADSVLTVAALASSLTEERQAKRILERAGWTLDEPLPDRFELLFTVPHLTGDLGVDPGEAELIAWRGSQTPR
jgi:hypothetical protein